MTNPSSIKSAINYVVHRYRSLESKLGRETVLGLLLGAIIVACSFYWTMLHSGSGFKIPDPYLTVSKSISGNLQAAAQEALSLDPHVAAVGNRSAIESIESTYGSDTLVAARNVWLAMLEQSESISPMDVVGYIESCRGLSSLELLRGHPQMARDFARRILLLAPGDGNALMILGVVLFAEGRLDEAEASFQEVLAGATEEDESDLLAAVYRNLARIHRTRGELDRAEKMLCKALVIDEKLGREAGMASTYGNLGLVYRTRGELDRAQEMLRQSLAINEKLGRREGMADQYGNLGLLYRTRGDLDQAEQMHLKSLAINKKLGRLVDVAVNYGNLGMIYKTRGDLDRAEEMLRNSLAIEEKLGRQVGMARQYSNLGLVYLTRDDLDRAEEMHRRSLAIAEKLGHREGMAISYANLGGICEERDDLDQARTFWIKARDLYRQIGMKHREEQLAEWIRKLDEGE